MSPGPWVVIGCGRTKRPHAAPALDLYCSAYALVSAAWARSVTSEGRILVLSAKHGLIDSRTVIEPYDVSFHPTGRHVEPPVTEGVVGAQAAEFGLRGTVITLAGKTYRDILARATAHAVTPLNPFVDLIRARGDVPGMGHQMAAMKEWTGRIPGWGDPVEPGS